MTAYFLRRLLLVPVTFVVITFLVYAIQRQDPVFIAGQAGGLLIYARNLHFVRRDKRSSRDRKA